MGYLANYIATHYQRSETPGRFSKLRLLERSGGEGEGDGEFEDRDLVDRSEVIALLDEGERIFCWDYDTEDLGEELELVRVKGQGFVRTDGQRLRADQLGELPEV